MGLSPLGMKSRGNVLDQLEERFDAFIAHERRNYRKRLDRELAGQAQLRGNANEGIAMDPGS